jgi:hypothetical protein
MPLLVGAGVCRPPVVCRSGIPGVEPPHASVRAHSPPGTPRRSRRAGPDRTQRAQGSAASRSAVASRRGHRAARGRAEAAACAASSKSRTASPWSPARFVSTSMGSTGSMRSASSPCRRGGRLSPKSTSTAHLSAMISTVRRVGQPAGGAGRRAGRRRGTGQDRSVRRQSTRPDDAFRYLGTPRCPRLPAPYRRVRCGWGAGCATGDTLSRRSVPAPAQLRRQEVRAQRCGGGEIECVVDVAAATPGGEQAGPSQQGQVAGDLGRGQAPGVRQFAGGVGPRARVRTSRSRTGWASA